MATIYSLETDGLVWYVGSTIDVKKRKSAHLTRNQKGVGYLIPKEYEFQFKILEETQIENKLIRERYWIENLTPFLNIQYPGRSHSERQRLWVQANPEKKKEMDREWRENNLEMKREADRQYQQLHRDKIREYQREYMRQYRAKKKALTHPS